jgi:teichuronic acid biosynthesis glycosyltransferase TuaH
MTGSHVGRDWQGLIVICAGTAWGRGWYPSEKHMAKHLSRWAPVLYVDPPQSPLARGRDGDRTDVGLRIVGPRLAVLTPRALPGQSRPVIRGTTAALTRRAVTRALRSLGVTRARGMVVANHTDMFEAVDAELRVVYATDDFVAGADLLGLDERYLVAEKRGQAAHADRIIVVSDQLGERWRGLGHNPVLIPNGCDTERFSSTDQASWPDDVDLPAPRAGVFGHLSHRIDLTLLEAVAARGISLLLVGTVQPSFSLGSLLANRNVRYLGPKPFEMMPSYLRVIDVGLTPYADIEFNRASFPLKTLEYLAAGRASVSTDLPAVRWLGTDLVSTATGPEAFADAVAREINRPRTPELVARRRAFARQHSWTTRAEQFAAVLGLAEGALPGE